MDGKIGANVKIGTIRTLLWNPRHIIQALQTVPLVLTDVPPALGADPSGNSNVCFEMDWRILLLLWERPSFMHAQNNSVEPPDMNEKESHGGDDIYIHKITWSIASGTNHKMGCSLPLLTCMYVGINKWAMGCSTFLALGTGGEFYTTL